jgi:hypothetical protein
LGVIAVIPVDLLVELIKIELPALAASVQASEQMVVICIDL